MSRRPSAPVCPVCSRPVSRDRPHFHGAHVARAGRDGVTLSPRPGAKPQPLKIRGLG